MCDQSEVEGRKEQGKVQNRTEKGVKQKKRVRDFSGSLRLNLKNNTTLKHNNTHRLSPKESEMHLHLLTSTGALTTLHKQRDAHQTAVLVVVGTKKRCFLANKRYQSHGRVLKNQNQSRHVN